MSKSAVRNCFWTSLEVNAMASFSAFLFWNLQNIKKIPVFRGKFFLCTDHQRQLRTNFENLRTRLKVITKFWAFICVLMLLNTLCNVGEWVKCQIRHHFRAKNLPIPLTWFRHFPFQFYCPQRFCACSDELPSCWPDPQEHNKNIQEVNWKRDQWHQ